MLRDLVVLFSGILQYPLLLSTYPIGQRSPIFLTTLCAETEVIPKQRAKAATRDRWGNMVTVGFTKGFTAFQSKSRKSAGFRTRSRVPAPPGSPSQVRSRLAAWTHSAPGDAGHCITHPPSPIACSATCRRPTHLLRRFPSRHRASPLPAASRQHLADHLAVDIGQAAVGTVVPERQPLVVEPQQMQHRRMEVVGRGDVVRRLP